MDRRPTIADVAKLAGVSARTVSRVINARGYVSSETRDRVLSVIRSLQYQPNPVARAMAGAPAQTIGVVIGHEPRIAFSNPFLSEVLRGIGHVASQNGYQVMLYTGESNLPYASLLATNQIGAMVFMSVPATDPRVARVVEGGYPVVLTCRYQDSERVYTVDVDNEAGAFMAVEHLIRYGHRTIAMVTGPANHMTTVRRVAGYRQALERYGIFFDPALVAEGDYSEESGYRLTHLLLAMRPDLSAIFAAGDLMAIGVVKALVQNGRRVPEDVSVVGFDDISMARYLQPPLTTVRQPGFDKGAIAAEMAIQLARGRTPQQRHVTLAPELVARGSAAPVRVPAPAGA
ncbi:MAG: LacI family DNA-binding transcriptional regulator [Bacillota bacterium]